MNIGGCFVPLALVAYEMAYLLGTPAALVGLAFAVAANVIACYLLARPVPGIGIAMPGPVSALIAVLAALVFAPQQATPVAFIAGVIGPVVGGDLLHLRHVTRIPSATVSIGGAGTFDSILLSGILAAYLA